jgi:hypothetical protein
MFEDSFYQIHSGEIFVKTQCMQQEAVVMDFFRTCLINRGYSTDDFARRLWKRGDRQAVVCLADDFKVCGAKIDQQPFRWFDANTVVLTDNYITVPTQYEVFQVPTSYFGIFAYRPELQEYQPERRFSFSINRLDTQRELIFLEMARQSGGFGQLLDLDFVNFNAWDANGDNSTRDQVKNNVRKYWNQIETSCQQPYQTLIEQLINLVPVKNHTWSIEQAHLKSWLAPVVETYSGNTTMAFSEKIFRALQTPMPWTVYSATGAVQYLKSLNFDVLDDLVDHSYNLIVQDSPHGLAKITQFVSSSINTVQHLQGMDLSYVKHRCQQAALHNQDRLAKMRLQWPLDFANWLPNAIPKLL